MRIIYYDTETTGTSFKEDNIIEIAAYDPEEDRTFESFVNPGRPIPKAASDINHITDDMVATADTFEIVGQRFIEFCEGDVILLAHNNDRFDLHFLRREYERNNLTMPSWKFLDSLKWARRYRYDLPEHNLQFLRKTYGIEANNAHRALEDVKVLYKVFKAMTEDLSVEAIYSLMKEPRLISKMPFGKHKGKAILEVPRNYVRWLADNGALDKDENQQLRQSFEKAGLLK